MTYFEVQLSRRVTEYRIVTVRAGSERAARRIAKALVRGQREPGFGEFEGEWCDGLADDRIKVERADRAAIAKAESSR